MGAVTWLKVVLPFLIEIGKEILNPKAETKCTTFLERLSVLVIVSLFCMLVYVGEQFFLLHQKKVELAADVTRLENIVADQKVRLDALMFQPRETLAEKPPPLPLPYDKRGERERRVARDEDLRDSARARMVDWINGAN